ncbi:helix-turn-helix domain-containing protein [Metaclostridioides mangenotii]|uniref:helix-turn-helix domain-containing protein n=1 Tax=Metaclostridioides mangenotii TaxID=1540 RepID=UPI001F3DDB82|nr:helix-turn-helix domain-containing protein [Clostridioides mangenotii]
MTNAQALEAVMNAMQIIIKNNNQEPQVNKVEVTKEIIKEETLLTAKIENVLFTVEELKQILKVSKGDVYSLINKGELKALKLGRLKVPYFEVERFLRDNLGRDFDFKN